MGVPLSQPAQPPSTDPPPAAGPPVPAPPPTGPPTLAPNSPASGSGAGFPENTPIVEMTIEQQAAYWRHHSRRHEDSVRNLQSRYADYDSLAAKAAEADRLRQERETESEKAVREAVENARKTAQDEVRPQLVGAEFRAASAGRIDAERLVTLTEDIDMSRYVKPDGTVDLAKVAAKVDAWAPKPAPPDPNAPTPPPRGVRPDPTQGARGTKTTGTDLGREMFENRRGKKQPAS